MRTIRLSTIVSSSTSTSFCRCDADVKSLATILSCKPSSNTITDPQTSHRCAKTAFERARRPQRHELASEAISKSQRAAHCLLLALNLKRRHTVRHHPSPSRFHRPTVRLPSELHLSPMCVNLRRDLTVEYCGDGCAVRDDAR